MNLQYGINAPYGTPSRLYGISSPNTNYSWSIEVDWDGDGVFNGTSESARVIGYESTKGRPYMVSINSDGKIDGFSGIDVGRCSILFDNTDDRYDPTNTSSPLYPNVKVGRYVRVRVTVGTTTYSVFAGQITNITPYDSPDVKTVLFEIEDGWRLLCNAAVDVGIQTSASTSTAIGLVLDEVGWPSIYGRNIDDTSTENLIPYWWANDLAATEIHRLETFGIGTFFIAENGNASFFKETHWYASSAGGINKSKFLKNMTYNIVWENVRNQINYYARPLKLKAAGDIWKMQDVTSIDTGVSTTYWGQYNYNAAPCPALNVVTPVATTDYTANAQADGLGADLTANISIVFTNFGRSAKLVVTNNGGTLAYITLLKVRGDALVSDYPTIGKYDNAISQASYGIRSLDVDVYWSQDSDIVNSLAFEYSYLLGNPIAIYTVQLEGREEQFSYALFNRYTSDWDFYGSQILNGAIVAHVNHKWLTENGQSVLTTLILEPHLLEL